MWTVIGKRMAGGSVFTLASPGPVDRSIVREGRLKTLEITPDTEVDIKWSMHFEWVSRGGRQDKVANVRRDDDVAAATASVQASIAALDQNIDSKIRLLNNGIPLAAS